MNGAVFWPFCLRRGSWILWDYISGTWFLFPGYMHWEPSLLWNIWQVNPSDVIILEGILIFHDHRVRELMNMKIFVDTGQQHVDSCTWSSYLLMAFCQAWTCHFKSIPWFLIRLREVNWYCGLCWLMLTLN